MLTPFGSRQNDYKMATKTIADILTSLSPSLISRTRTDFGYQAFSAAGPRVCNNLPSDLRQPDLIVMQPS